MTYSRLLRWLQKRKFYFKYMLLMLLMWKGGGKLTWAFLPAHLREQLRPAFVWSSLFNKWV